MSLAEQSKNQLRRKLRQRRQTLDQAVKRQSALSVAEHIRKISGWREARRIALYLAADSELDTTPLCGLCRQSGKELFLPVIEPDDSLRFAAWPATCALTKNRYGIPEPPASAGHCPAADLDIIFLPLVGWDRNGGRLGMGGGFYDRTLAGVRGPVLVGLAHACQEVEQVPRDDWDIAVDFIATGSGLHDCAGPG